MTSTANPDHDDHDLTKKHCAATKKNGEPCAAWALTGSDFCFWHDPDKAKERAEARKKGGEARHGRRLIIAGAGEALEINDLADVIRLLAEEVNIVRGTCEPSIARARAVGYLAGQLVTAYKQSELEEQYSALERALRERDKRK